MNDRSSPLFFLHEHTCVSLCSCAKPGFTIIFARIRVHDHTHFARVRVHDESSSPIYCKGCGHDIRCSPKTAGAATQRERERGTES